MTNESESDPADADPHPAILAALQAIPHSERFPPDTETGNPCWLFTLPALYFTCCSLDDRIQKLGYHRFRQLLYANPTNQQLSRAGLHFEIAHYHGHVDSNVYRLVATARNPTVSG